MKNANKIIIEYITAHIIEIDNLEKNNLCDLYENEIENFFQEIYKIEDSSIANHTIQKEEWGVSQISIEDFDGDIIIDEKMQ